MNIMSRAHSECMYVLEFVLSDFLYFSPFLALKFSIIM